jgi:hypothetical protein
MSHEHAFSSLPLPSSPDSRGCPSGRASTHLLTRPLDSIHSLRRAISHSFLPNRNRNHTHGPHTLPHPDSGRHHFLDVFMHFPQLPLPPVNCSSLEAKHTTVYAMIYILSQRGIFPQPSCKPAEMFPTHVTHIVPCSQALSF